jgi:O-antigen/teichoic acid export membrane protein
MFIAFYTSRVVLDKLGEIDFGIYNVVSSLAVSFTFFSSALVNATQRFITVALGKDDVIECNKVFNQHLIAYTIIALVVFLVAEIVGVWYINNKINIPEERIDAALIIFHIAMISLLWELVNVAFQAFIIAYEDMKLYSYISVFEGVFKLVVVFVLTYVAFDKLVLYAFLMLMITFLCKAYYMYYSLSHYKECYIHWCWDKKLIKSTFSFVGWNLIGNTQIAINDQGISLLLNSFFGPVVNTARGITAQVSGAIFRFATNILIATQPQIVKSYAREDFGYLENLFFTSSRFICMALWAIQCPVLFNIEGILSIWLKEVPQWTEQFVMLSICGSIPYALTKPIWSIVVASGNLRKYVLWSNGISLLLFPTAYVFLKLGFSPVVVYMCSCCVTIISTIVQLWVIRTYFVYSFFNYIKQVILPIVLVIISSIIICSMIPDILDSENQNTILRCVIMLIISISMIGFWGIKKEERRMIYNRIKHK